MICKGPSFIQRKGIVLSSEQIPYDSALVFNASVCRYNNGFAMLFRNDYGFCRQDFDDYYAGISDNTVPHTNIGLAFSKDGKQWHVDENPVFSISGDDIWRAYDPRISSMEDDEFAISFAVDSQHGTRGGIAITKDFHNFDIKDISVPENRNIVLFPGKINGNYYRLERPFCSHCDRNYAIWISSSPDLIHWGEAKILLDPQSVPFGNSKIGSAAPPLKTPFGWLTMFHSVENVPEELNSWGKDWHSRYYAGIMLLDLNDPSKLLAVAPTPLIVPETKYECTGFRGEVIFPGAMLQEDDIVKIYYGAADTVECLAEAKLQDLIDFCHQS